MIDFAAVPGRSGPLVEETSVDDETSVRGLIGAHAARRRLQQPRARTRSGTRGARRAAVRESGAGDARHSVPELEHHLRHAEPRSRRREEARRRSRRRRIGAVHQRLRRMAGGRERRARAAGDREPDHDSRPPVRERPAGAARSRGLQEVRGRAWRMPARPPTRRRSRRTWTRWSRSAARSPMRARRATRSIARSRTTRIAACLPRSGAK